MSQDDLSTRENQRPPSRRGRLAWIVSLNIVAIGTAAGLIVGITSGGIHSEASPASPSSVATEPVQSAPAVSSSSTSSGDAGGPTLPGTPSFSGAGANQLPCSDEGSIHSAQGGSEVRFSFINDTPESLRIIWLNYVGARETYGMLPPGYRYSVKTYTGSGWIVADSSADCLSIFSLTDSGEVTAS